MTKTLGLTPRPGEMLKPSELIELHGMGPLTLQDRKVYNMLIEHAWGTELGKAGHWFEIETGKLRDATDRNARLAPSITRLMQTVCLVVSKDGKEETRVQLLGATVLKSSSNSGTLRYKIPEDLAELLKDSTIFAKLDLAVMQGFSSKYAFALYEAVSRRVRMRNFLEDFTVDEMRELLGVEAGKLLRFSNLNTRAIQPALTEVNAISPYEVSIGPKKKGKKVIGFKMGWNTKSTEGQKEAYSELNRHRAGRKARLEGTVEQPIER